MKTQKGMNQLFVVDENAELFKYSAEWSKKKKKDLQIHHFLVLVSSDHSHCLLSPKGCLLHFLCNAFSKQFLVLEKLRKCSHSHLCPFLSSLWRTPLLLHHFFHNSSVFSHFWKAAKAVVALLGLPVCFVLFPDGSLSSCGSLARICPQVIITLMYFLPVSISSCYLLCLRVQQI